MKNLLTTIFLLAIAASAQGAGEPLAWDLGGGISTGLNRLDLVGLTGMVNSLPEDPPTRTGGLVYHSSVYSTRDNLSYSFRTKYDQEAFSYRSPERWRLEVAPMIGLTTGSSWWSLSASTGLGLVTGIELGRFLKNDWNDHPIYATRYVASLSIPLELKATVFPFENLGGGVRLTGSINGVYTNSGLEMFITFRRN